MRPPRPAPSASMGYGRGPRRSRRRSRAARSRGGSEGSARPPPPPASWSSSRGRRPSADFLARVPSQDLRSGLPPLALSGLGLVQLPVDAPVLDQLLMGAALDDP